MRLALLTLATLLGSDALGAQGFSFQVGRLFAGPDAVTYRFGHSFGLAGPVGAAVHAAALDGRGGLQNLWGVGGDLSLFRSGRPGFYGIGGVEAGVAVHGGDTFWSSWSVGAGYEVFPIRGLSLALEGRFRYLDVGRQDGVELGVRLGLDRGSKSRSRSSDRTERPAAPDPETIRTELDRSGATEEHAARIGAVLQTALDVMGMPYRWGDEGEEGFDCSGLIRYAFGKQGVLLPRRSVDQAREGAAVSRDLDSLRAGDILTFATTGTRVSHVGLYLGEGKFIHSATGGVQISVLSPDDVSGRWWWKRWVGARRIIS